MTSERTTIETTSTSSCGSCKRSDASQFQAPLQHFPPIGLCEDDQLFLCSALNDRDENSQYRRSLHGYPVSSSEGLRSADHSQVRQTGRRMLRTRVSAEQLRTSANRRARSPTRAGRFWFPLPGLASLLACWGSPQMVYSAAAPAAAAVTRIARLTPISTMKLTTRATMPTLRS